MPLGAEAFLDIAIYRAVESVLNERSSTALNPLDPWNRVRGALREGSHASLQRALDIALKLVPGDIRLVQAQRDSVQYALDTFHPIDPLTPPEDAQVRLRADLQTQLNDLNTQVATLGGQPPPSAAPAASGIDWSKVFPPPASTAPAGLNVSPEFAAMWAGMSEPQRQAFTASQRSGSAGAPAGGGSAPAGAGLSSTAPTAGSPGMPAIFDQFPWAAYYLNDPEIGPIIKGMADGSLSLQAGQIKLHNTHWWQTHSEAERTHGALLAADPATAEQNLVTRTQQITDLAVQLGADISPAQAHTIANHTLWFGVEDQPTWSKLIMAYVHLAPGAPLRGQMADTAQRMKAFAADYYIKPDEKTIDDWITKVMLGTATEADFQSQIRDQAKALWAPWSGAIDQGFSVRQYVQPYAQATSQMLGIPETQLDWTDPKWHNLLFATDPKTGTAAARSIFDVQNTIRNDPTYGWAYTPDAHDQAATMEKGLTQMFGVGI